MIPRTVTETHTTRAPVDPPVTFAQFLVLLYRGLDESVPTQRAGERIPAWVANRGQR